MTYREKTPGGSVRVTGKSFSAIDAWPVGSVFIGYTTTSPATLLGGGTWTRLAEGRMLINAASFDSDFDTIGDTGGAKTHTLTEAEMPDHNHGAGSYATSTDGAHVHDAERSNATGGGANMARGTNVDDVVNAFPIISSGAHSHNVTGTSGQKGGGLPHNNMPPYLAVYMWRRTA